MARFKRMHSVVPNVRKLTRCAGLGLAVSIAPVVPRGGVFAQDRTTPAERFPVELDRYIEKVLVDWQIPGLAVAIVRNDSVMAAKGYGVRELGKAGAVDANTVFDIASLSKSFTATAAAILVDKGLLRWDDPVRRHLDLSGVERHHQRLRVPGSPSLRDQPRRHGPEL